VAALKVTGTAASGAAIAGATVEAKCNGGNGSATTAADGTYSVTLATGVSLPCVLKVTVTGGDLYSAAAGTGSSATANITPFTQLIVADLGGKDPAAYFTGFGASDISALTSTALGAAAAQVATVLKNNGIDTSALGDLITGNLVAANGTTTGNAYDQALDTLNSKLTTSGSTLANLTTTVVQTATSTTTTVPSGTPSVALDVALQPAAASCSALRSGTYRVIQAQIEVPANNGASSSEKVGVNAAASATTFVVTNADATTTTLTAVPGDPCHFTGTTGDDVIVSQAGVIVFKDASVTRVGIAFPEQSISLADMAGDWNLLGYDRQNTTDPLTPFSATVQITSAGAISFKSYCVEAKTCAPNTTTASIVANTAGGFDIVNGTDRSRAFAFRAGGGEMIFIGVSQDATIVVGTHVRTLSLPTAGTVNQGWGIAMQNALVGTVYDNSASDVGPYKNTIDSVDAVANTFTRTAVTNFTANPLITRPETFTVNQVAGVAARNGYNYRNAATVLNSNKASTTVREFIQMPLRGTGINILAFPAPTGGPAEATSFQFSVAKP
jgi:hypothetical protein